MQSVVRVRANTLDQATRELVRLNREQAERIMVLEETVERLKACLSEIAAASREIQTALTAAARAGVKRGCA